MTDLITFVQAHLTDLGLLLALLVRVELALAKLTKTTADDAIAAKVANAVKSIGVDPTKPIL